MSRAIVVRIYAPDVALVNYAENNFVHIGIGSGYRAHLNRTPRRWLSTMPRKESEYATQPL